MPSLLGYLILFAVVGAVAGIALMGLVFAFIGGGAC